MEWLWLIFLILIGACVGSFLNVVIWRLPRGESIVFPASHCPSCGRRIRWYDNIPLVSWFVLRGRCRFCDVRISPRYLLTETATSAMFAGLFICYYMLDVRDGAGAFADTWPMYVAHITLLCGLLVCSVVDIEMWIIPLEVMWFCSLVGVISAAASPHPWVAGVWPGLIAMSAAAVVGLIVSLLLTRWGYLTPSFLDAGDKPLAEPDVKAPANARASQAEGEKPSARPQAVAITAAHGVNPRREVLRELAFLAPAMSLASITAIVYLSVPQVAGWCRTWLQPGPENPAAAAHIAAAGAAVFGYLIGGLWIWGMRIGGTLAFGKEAMGMGDVHVLAAVGAVTGWIVPSIAFFLAPFFGLLWALYVFAGRRQKELPYGPWLAAAAGVVLLAYDPIVEFITTSLAPPMP